MNKNIDDIWERLHGIAIGTGGISDNLDILEKSLTKNTDKLVEALNENSKSANYLAKVGIFIGIVGTIATVIGTIYGILSYLK